MPRKYLKKYLTRILIRLYIEENGLKIVEGLGLLTETVKKIVDANPGPLAELLGGKDKVMGFFKWDS